MKRGTMQPSRRAWMALAAAGTLGGCGFALRGAPHFDFESIHLALPAGSMATALQRQLEGAGLKVTTDAADRPKADVVLESPGEERRRVIVSMSAAGEVRELELHLIFGFRVVTPAGRELLPRVEIERQIDQSYSESEALSKEEEAQMLFENMQGDIAQQVVRRLATIEVPS